jgi:hypothetical protein
MLRIVQLEEIEQKLLEVPALVEGCENHDFTGSVEYWLREVDEILQRNRLAVAGKIAGLRGILLSVRKGALAQGIEITGRSTLRKRLTATALDAINRTANIVDASIQGDRVRINEAERIALQLVSVSRACGLIEGDGANQDGPAYARHLIMAMKSTKATIQGVIQLEGLVGTSDAIILIDRSLNYGLDQI